MLPRDTRLFGHFISFGCQHASSVATHMSHGDWRLPVIIIITIIIITIIIIIIIGTNNNEYNNEEK